MTDGNSKIYPVSADKPTERATDATLQVHGATIHGDGSIEPSVSSIFETNGGTAALSSDVDTVDFGGANAKNINRFEYNVAVDSLGQADNSSSSVTIDVSQQGVWELVVQSDIQIGFSGAEDSGVFSATVFIEHDGTTNITFDSSVNWDADSGVPAFSSAGEVAVTVYTRDGGTSWNAMKGGEWLA